MSSENNVIILALVLLTFFSSGCLGNDDNEGYNQSNIHYSVSIIINETFNYTIYLPVYQNSTGSYLPINADIIIKEGNATINKISTIYGVALQIESNESIELELNQTYNNLLNATDAGPWDKWSLSLYEGEYRGGYWIFYDNGNDTSKTINILLFEDSRYYFRFSMYNAEDSFEVSLNNSGWVYIPTEIDYTIGSGLQAPPPPD